MWIPIRWNKDWSFLSWNVEIQLRGNSNMHYFLRKHFKIRHLWESKPIGEYFLSLTLLPRRPFLCPGKVWTYCIQFSKGDGICKVFFPSNTHIWIGTHLNLLTVHFKKWELPTLFHRQNFAGNVASKQRYKSYKMLRICKFRQRIDD